MSTIELPGVNMTSPGGANSRITNYAVSAQAPVASTETVVSGSQIVLPAGGLKVGTRLRWKLAVVKTAAGTGASTFKIKSNTSIVVAVGTTGGAATMASLVAPTETAAIDEGVYVIEAVITAVSAAAGTLTAELALTHALSATGLANGTGAVVAVAATTIDTSNDVLSVGLSITTGASEALTIHYCTAEAEGLAVSGV